ncbi:bifunctional 4-hydroxy-2-oxoglutarate aldolase/2-dehydro-3-deoxy-phosphogluconate aldolase [Lapillicoccus jejuensis]|uniref:2-dehydro-3-deoxy-phosphogluconate aldolase n=1 Tax=Lapillicoccus jejuensis TaxID=402171 RepID=A0A542DYT3_9MICO|nr:bifunctional 4-hydroxy-2-oxoglutarate aldolase/2-dehydro-3-deoxy-phosphogluconate aldolase [Lapillicoccus jejuensis]TQJ08206.1 2-dehydro-3-deoxyphosphogluconate aldolase/(4S)-4-hydroxy-2-oxoglutarate aldolase [Lapillicoccus jejuensis]
MTTTATPALAPRTGAEVLDVAPVVPVVVVEEVAQAVPLAQALLRGGIGVIEITLRSAAGLEAIRAVAAEVPGMVVGAGTVVTPEQALAVTAAGASFVVTPGSPPRLVDAVLDLGIPALCGTGTLTEMLTLAERGLTAMKFFPAEVSGGAPYLSAVHGPCPQLRFCPTGGISPANAASYLALPNVGCVGGSWLTPKDAVAAGDWARVEALAAAAAGLRTAS